MSLFCMFCLLFFRLQPFLTAVIDVVRVAVFLLLLLVRVTPGHDEVTGPGYVSSLCGQEVNQLNTTIKYCTTISLQLTFTSSTINFFSFSN